jgi:RNA ligase
MIGSFTLSQAVEATQGCKEFSFIFDEKYKTTTVCYNYTDKNTFETPLRRELRGIVFGENGHIISRPLHKFFNLGEKEETQIVKLDFTKPFNLLEKLDGSMIHNVCLNAEIGEYALKSKKSYDSDVAKAATDFVSKSKEWGRLFEVCTRNNVTAICEFTSPKNRIVINYGDNPNMTLLHFRHNATGEYLSIDSFITNFEIGSVKKHNYKSIGELTNFLKTEKNIEGFVIDFGDGHMVKAKTDWYIDNHKIFSGLRVRDVVELILDEKIDDIKSKISLNGGDLNDIARIEKDVIDKINNLKGEVFKLLERYRGFNLKDVALLEKNNYLFPLFILEFKGGYANYISFFKRKYLDNFSLENVKL